LIQIDAEQLSQMAALKKVPVGSVIQHEIDNGLRAGLEVESFITGLLFIDLNYFPNAGPPEYFQQTRVYSEIPTMRASFSTLGNSANDLIAKLNSIDFAGLAAELKNLAAGLNHSISQVDPKSLAGSIDSLNAILKQAKDKDFGSSMGQLAKNLSQSTGEGGDFAESLKAIRSAAQNFGDLSGELRGAVRGDTAAGTKLYRLMDGLTEASESLSRLADYLEQNPNAILTGKRPVSEEE
jgi:paraquat-inducible protein B